MDMTDLDEEMFRRQLEGMDEETIRKQVAMDAFKGGQERRLAEAFLEQKREERELAHRPDEDDRTQAGDVGEEGIRWAIVAAVIAVGVFILTALLRIVGLI